MKEARSVHPVIVLPRPGTLHVTVSGNRVSLTGDGDLASRAEFERGAAVARRLPASTLVLDISRPVLLRRAQHQRRAPARGGADPAAAT